MDKVSSVLSSLEKKLGGGDENDRSKLVKQAIEMLFSDDPEKIIQTTRLKEGDLQWVTAVELLKNFLVKDWCDADNNLRIQSVVNAFYQSRVSVEGKYGNGRTEMFEAIKVENNLQTIMDLNKGEDRRA